MFNQEYNLTWKQLNVALGIDDANMLDLDHATRRFNKAEFWESMTTSHNCSNPRPDEIHNPTLCFLHYWIALTLFPGNDVHSLSTEELRLLYAMNHKICVSPVKLLVAFWQGVFSRKGPIEFTSLITYIADTMNLLDGAHSFEFITTDRGILTEAYFIHAHMLKRDPRGGLKMIYRGHTAEVPLPNEKHHLYRAHQLIFGLDLEARHQSFVGIDRVT
jgi:hypothetical protein